MHRLEVLYMDGDTLVRELSEASDKEFLHYYISGIYNQCPIVSMVWEHKGETHKLVFGD